MAKDFKSTAKAIEVYQDRSGEFAYRVYLITDKGTEYKAAIECEKIAHYIIASDSKFMNMVLKYKNFNTGTPIIIEAKNLTTQLL